MLTVLQSISQVRKSISAVVGTAYLVLTIMVAFHVHADTHAHQTAIASSHEHAGHVLHVDGYCPLAQYAAQAFFATVPEECDGLPQEGRTSRIVHGQGHCCSSHSGIPDPRGPPRS